MIDANPEIKPKRTCNRHNDCDEAEADYHYRHGTSGYIVDFHCHREDCEECFGY